LPGFDAAAKVLRCSQQQHQQFRPTSQLWGKLIRWSDLINLFCFRCEYIFAFPQITGSTLAGGYSEPRHHDLKTTGQDPALFN